MTDNLTRKDIATIAGIHPAHAHRLLIGCPYTEESCRGGSRRTYTLDALVDRTSSLPEHVKLAILAHRQDDSGNLPVVREDDGKKLAKAQVDNALAKGDLVRLYQQFVDKAPRGKKVQAREDFCTAYNTGIPWPELHQSLGDLAWKTIEGWKTKLKKSKDTLALADGRGYTRRGASVITPEQASIIIRCALDPNQPLISEVIRTAKSTMHVAGIANGHSEATYRRFIKDWISRHMDIWTFHREGATAWNDKCAYYIERNYDLINVGDILVADGHVLNFEILNPFTGKPKRMALICWFDMKSSMPLGWEIMPTENTQTINAALRRAIIQLGKIPKVAYLDNGRAFRARFFRGCPNFEAAGLTGLYERLGMKTIFAWPYHGQSKTVERFFKTFGELERKAITYVGTDIAHQPARMHRGEKLHRRVWDKIAQGQCITLEQAHTAIAAWFDEYAHRPTSDTSHLKGQRPIDVFMDGRGPGVQDQAALYIMMMAEEDKTVHRNGVTHRGQNYYAPELYGYRRHVMIRYDLADPSFILVYDYDDLARPLCMATPTPKVHPAAHALGDEADQALLKEQIHFKRAQEKHTTQIARALLETEILPHVHNQAAQLGMDPARIPANTTPQMEAPKELTEADEAAILKEYQESQAMNQPEDYWASMDELMDRDKYERIIEARVLEMLIPKQWQAFARYYEETDDYRQNQSYFDEYEIKAVWEHQAQQAQNS